MFEGITLLFIGKVSRGDGLKGVDVVVPEINIQRVFRVVWFVGR